ncbi:acyl carrier protein [Parafrankia colletiae]|uniref:Acyl carrier protein n=1 Tax=Parafrankia colletiae TaxID=573497 RepID=A0A1S1R6F1_9ACTN|nr:acyl carrier protein [Parafrankia colletiae]MCK9903759.1 acyl carrier protein [Frankia sp. Cpl3]OHV40314.1 acyl carrier protein [Parafrankia colletiae]
MKTVDDLVTIIRDEIGLPVTPADAELPLPDVIGWDSVHLLALCVILERETARPISLPDVLEAPTLKAIYEVAVSTGQS